MFYSLKNLSDFERIVEYETFFSFKDWTCTLVIKHVLSSTHFSDVSLHAFPTFPLKYSLYKKIKLSDKNYLSLTYTFIGMIIFWRSIHLSFKSHQMCTFSAGFGMALNRYGLQVEVSKSSIWKLKHICHRFDHFAICHR